MKKIIILSAALCCVLLSRAQSSDAVFKPFKVDISFGGALPAGSGAKSGGIFAVEPKYAITDDISVGLRIEAAVTARAFTYSDGTSSTTDVAANGSYLATADYYFSDDDFRPFAGAGVGIFSFASATTDGYNASTTAQSAFGGMIRAGFEYGHFRLGVEYNVVGSSSETLVDPNTGNSSTSTSKNGYLGIKLGVLIGGGRY